MYQEYTLSIAVKLKSKKVRRRRTPPTWPKNTSPSSSQFIRENTLAKQVCNAAYEWPFLEQFMGKYCPIVPCLNRPSKSRCFINGDLPSNYTTQNQPTLTKKLMQTSFVQTDFAVYLCRFYIFYQQKRPLYGLSRAMSNRVFRFYENVYLNLTLSSFNPLPKLARVKDKLSQWLWLESWVVF